MSDDPCISLLRELVAIDSVNPSLVPGARGEGAIAARRGASTCARSASTCTCRRCEPGRPNVIGVLDGRAARADLMFCGHLDTVGVEGMADAVRCRSSATAGCTAAGRRT